MPQNAPLDSHDVNSLAAHDNVWTRWFWLFALAHVALWMLVPLFTEPNVSLDASEMVLWGREWQAGYHKHPPLPAWIAQASCYLFSQSAWPTHLAAQACIVACLWSAWQLAREFLRPAHAMCAAFVLEASHYYTYSSTEFNNNVVSRAMWALAIYSLYRAIKTQRRATWALTGVVLGMGMLSKYDTAVLAFVMLGFSLLHPSGRRCWKTAGPWIMLAAAIACVTPHLVWLWDHDFPTITYALRRAGGDVAERSVADHLLNPLSFLVAQIAAIAPMLLAGMVILQWPVRRRQQAPSETFARDYLLAMVLCPPAIILTLSFLTGMNVRSMWGSALWTYVGVLGLSTFELRTQWTSIRRTFQICATASVVMAIALSVNNVVAPYVKTRGKRIHFPGRALALEVQRRWDTTGYGRLQAVGGTWWTAGNVAFYADTKPSVYGSLSPRQSPWFSDETFQRRGGVIVWQLDREPDYAPDRLKALFPHVEIQQPIELAWQTDASLSKLRFGLAFVPPTSIVVAREITSTQKR